MKVIYISGKAQHGKDTTAGFMKEAFETYGYRVLITHYGDLVKYICKTFFNWDGEKNEFGRDLLQKVGTDVVRTQRPNYWVEFVKGVLEMFKGEWDVVLIPDCRFPNEICEFGGPEFSFNHVRVIRPDFESPLTLEQQNHPSETSLDHIVPDYTIMNARDLDMLKDKAFILTAAIHMFMRDEM